MNVFENKTILITGGTGTVGRELIFELLSNFSPKVIRIYSRDETKQHLMSKDFKKYNEKLRFFLGDIRDEKRLYRAMKDVDIVFHLAALKHVVACEYNPFEAIKTNVLGIQNIIQICIDYNVEKFIFTSTDKAATPSNTMGVTKLLGEKLVTAANYYKGEARTIFYSVRFGNLLGSRGSLIPLIEKQIKNNQKITLTHKNMTRYIMDVKTAVNFILKTIDLAQGGEVFVHKMKALRIIDLISVLIDYFCEKYNRKVEKIEIEEIGMFSGEKLYEELFSIEEAERTYELDDMYVIIPQLTEVSNDIALNLYPNVEKFNKNKAFTSENSSYLKKSEILNFLNKNNIIEKMD